MPGIRGGLEPAFRPGTQTVLAHQFRHTPTRTAPTAGFQLAMHARAAVRPPALGRNAADLVDEFPLPSFTSPLRRAAPVVVAAGRDLQDLAQLANRVLRPMTFDEGVSHSDSLAKKAVAFFRISLVIRSCRFSSRRRC